MPDKWTTLTFLEAVDLAQQMQAERDEALEIVASLKDEITLRVERDAARMERDEAREIGSELLEFAESNCGCCLGYNPRGEVKAIRQRMHWVPKREWEK